MSVDELEAELGGSLKTERSMEFAIETSEQKNMKNSGILRLLEEPLSTLTLGYG